MENIMRSFRPSEYSVIKAALPLTHSLHLPRWFQDLPRDIKIAIATNQGTPNRFELYQGDLAEDHLIVVAYYNFRGKESMDLVAEYCNGTLVEKGIPINHAMLEKVKDLSEAGWTWKTLLGDNSGLSAGVAFTLFSLVCWLFFLPSAAPPEAPLKLHLLEYFMTAFIMGIGPTILVCNAMKGVMDFLKRRKFLSQMLVLYTAAP
jgi:hypothetical protein